MMSHYVIVDGCLQLSTEETKQWGRRASKGVPAGEREEAIHVHFRKPRTEYEIIEGLDETE